MDDDGNSQQEGSLFTFIMEYRGGTYISQVRSGSKEETCIRRVEGKAAWVHVTKTMA